MWITILVMAVAVSLEPFRIGMTVLMLSRPRPILQLLAFLCGGFAMGTTVGLVVLFVLRPRLLPARGNWRRGPGGCSRAVRCGAREPAAVTAPATQATFGGGADPFSQILNGVAVDYGPGCGCAESLGRHGVCSRAGEVGGVGERG